MPQVIVNFVENKGILTTATKNFCSGMQKEHKNARRYAESSTLKNLDPIRKEREQLQLCFTDVHGSVRPVTRPA